MDIRMLRLLHVLILCSLGSGLSSLTHRHQTHVQRSLSLRNMSSGHHSRSPHYMLQLFRTYQAADRISPLAVDAFATQSHGLPANSFDSVLSLQAEGCHQAGDRWKVAFDMSSISGDELVLLAEVQIRLPALSASTRASLDVFHSRKRSCRSDRTTRREEEVFLGSLSTTPSSTKSSWRVFNATALLKHWLQLGEQELNQEASGETQPESGSGEGNEENMSSSDGPLSIRGQKQRETHHPTSNQVMMIIYSKRNVAQEGHAMHSLIHTVENSKYVGKDTVRRRGLGRRHKRNRVQRIPAPSEAMVTPPAGSVQRPPCRKVDMWVDFEHIGWDEWIVHPKRYNAYRCEGECPIPLDESFNPTNHAFMQSLLQLHHPQRASCPACVPTRLSPLSMLYYEDEDLTLRHHEEMIVEECGCH